MDEWRALEIKRIEEALSDAVAKLHQTEVLKAREIAANASSSRISEIDDQKAALIAKRMELQEKLEKARRL